MIREYNNEPRFYNYLYLDPTKPGEYPIKGLNIILKFEPFYAGKGTGERYKHSVYVQSGRFMKNKINSLKEKGVLPIKILLNKNITNYEACENEKYLIKIIGRRDLNLGSLCNLTNGGEEGNGGKRSQETKDKMRKAQLGKTLSKEHKNKLSIAGKLRTDYMKGLLKAQEYWKTHIRTTNSKSVLMLDLNDNIIKVFKSFSEASKYTGLSSSCISRQCKRLGICKDKNKLFKFRYND